MTETLSRAELANVALTVMPAWLRTTAPASKSVPFSVAA